MQVCVVTKSDKSFVVGSPLGLVRAIRAESSASMNYLKASWLSFLQGEEESDCWDAFCPWLWSVNYVHAKLGISTFAIEDYQPSGYLMPFYLKVQIEQPRHFLLRVEALGQSSQVLSLRSFRIRLTN